MGIERIIKKDGREYKPYFFQNPNNDPCDDCDLSDDTGNCTCNELCEDYDEDEFGITIFKLIKSDNTP